VKETYILDFKNAGLLFQTNYPAAWEDGSELLFNVDMDN
jgi:hypothetical protein